MNLGSLGVFWQSLNTNGFVKYHEALAFILGQCSFTDGLIRIVFSDEALALVIDDQGAGIEHGGFIGNVLPDLKVKP